MRAGLVAGRTALAASVLPAWRAGKTGHMTPKIGRVFQLDDIVEAHRCMEENAAGGKIVVLT